MVHNEAKDNVSDMYFSSIRNIFHLENLVQFKSQTDLPVLLLHKSLNIDQSMPGVELIRNKHLTEIEIKQLGVVFQNNFHALLLFCYRKNFKPLLQDDTIEV